VTPESLHTTQLHVLLDRLQSGDVAARDELIRRAGQRLESLARAMLRRFPGVRRWEETADVFQNAVLRLLRALQQVRPESTRAFFGLAAEQVRRELLDLARHYQGRTASALITTACRRRGATAAGRSRRRRSPATWSAGRHSMRRWPGCRRSSARWSG
jgi:RNA polymerase sigma-70 factor (ECF subfamily)